MNRVARQHNSSNDSTQKSSFFSKRGDKAFFDVESLFSPKILPVPIVQLDRETTHHAESALTLGRADIEKWSKKDLATSYWYHKIQSELDVTWYSEAVDRFNKNLTEADAVLSVLWETANDHRLIRAGQLRKSVEFIKIIDLPAGKGGADSVMYKFRFSPNPNFQAGAANAKPNSVDIEFEKAFPLNPFKADAHSLEKKERRKAKRFKRKAETDNRIGPLEFRRSTFNLITPEKLFEQYPDYELYLYQELKSFFEVKSPSSFTVNRVVKLPITHEPGVASNYYLLLVMKREPEYMTNEVWFLGRQEPGEPPPQGFDKKGYTDFQLENLQKTPHPEKGDLLGTINGLDQIPQEESASVKYIIYQYFQGGSNPKAALRDSELDIIVPVAHQNYSVYYTLVFHPAAGNKVNVTVRRIGKKGTEMPDTESLDIGRVIDFPATGDAAALKAWLKKRYPGVATQGEDVSTIKMSANLQLRQKAGTVDWFKDNYKIYVIQDEKAAKSRLKSATSKKSAATHAGLKSFAENELKFLELSLQTMRPAVLKKLEYTYLIRQTESINSKGEKENWAGHAFHSGGSKYTVVIYDGAFKTSADFLFSGGGQGVHSMDIGTLTHELGHIVSYKSGLLKKFNKFVKDNNIDPITAYAGTKPEMEFFPEAFELYHTDPEWLQTNHPLLFNWFDALSKTGKPPK